MNIEAQRHLNAIINKSLHELTPTDIIFLKARRSYLTSDQEERFITILESETVVPSTPEVAEVKEDKKKEDTSLRSVLKEQISQMKYNDLVNQAKQFGYATKGKGRAKREELERFVLENS